MNKNLLGGGLAIIAIAIGIMNYANISDIEAAQNQMESVDADDSDESEVHYELAKAMGYLQTYTHKLYLAGKNENWELSDFYAHEIEETIEEVEEANVIDDGKDISALIGSMTKASFEMVEQSIDDEDSEAFAKSFKLLIASCNACHQATEYEFITIEIPTEGKLFNQKFSK